MNIIRRVFRHKHSAISTVSKHCWFYPHEFSYKNEPLWHDFYFKKYRSEGQQRKERVLISTEFLVFPCSLCRLKTNKYALHIKSHFVPDRGHRTCPHARAVCGSCTGKRWLCAAEIQRHCMLLWRINGTFKLDMHAWWWWWGRIDTCSEIRW